MNCRFEIIVRGGDSDLVDRAAGDALDEVDRIESLLSMYDPTSALSAINQAAARDAVVVDEEILEQLLLAAELWKQTEGAFDPTAGPLVRLWRGWRKQGLAPDGEAIAAVLQRVGMHHVAFDVQRRTVRFDRPGVEIDLGAMGKGYAVDRAASVLEGYGLEHFLVHGGTSSSVARGSVDDEHDGWPVGLSDPVDPESIVDTCVLSNQALGCSNQQNQHYQWDGQVLGHVLDPRTGWPARSDSSIVILSRLAMVADALSTACLVASDEERRRIEARFPGIRVLMFRGGCS